jgi:hypothetical protein
MAEFKMEFGKWANHDGQLDTTFKMKTPTDHNGMQVVIAVVKKYKV